MEGGAGEEDDESIMAKSWMSEYTIRCHGGVFSADNFQDFEFILLHQNSKIPRRPRRPRRPSY